MLLWCSLKKILGKEGWEKSYECRAGGKRVVFYRRGPDICEIERTGLTVVYTMHSTMSGKQLSYHNYKTGKIWYNPELKQKADEYFKTHKKFKKFLRG